MKNLLRSKLLENRKLLGTHVTLADPCLCDILGRAGYDYLWIDLEHTSLSNEQALVHIAMTQARGTAALVRVPPDDYVTLKRILENGPDFPSEGTARRFSTPGSPWASICFPPPATPNGW